jgi:hypothetical protein
MRWSLISAIWSFRQAGESSTAPAHTLRSRVFFVGLGGGVGSSGGGASWDSRATCSARKRW